jgi:hypothetical protein
VCGNSIFLTPSDDTNLIKLTDSIRKKADPSALMVEGFDGCIIGTDVCNGLVYDLGLMRSVMCKNLGMNPISADENLSELHELTKGALVPPSFVDLSLEYLNKNFN